ncbi:MAG: hypothetical protein M3437_05985 [Chloroflexota bacterium]|nr:hypothetical protein [Chloroflexota bacterium]MDQ5866238.1 hypothetical protein [Chloroflexota bacterium]
MQAQGDFVELMWGIVWRTGLLGICYGAIFGALYGLVQPALSGYLSAEREGDYSQVFGGLVLGCFFGLPIGITGGAILGLIISTAVSTLLILAAQVAIRHRASTRLYRFLAICATIVIITPGLILFLTLIGQYRATMWYWLLNIGLPVFLVVVAFGHISFLVSKWTTEPDKPMFRQRSAGRLA